MDDVKRIAEERASRPKAPPVGTGFESERQREKNALVRQLDAQDGRNVHKIAAASAAPEEDKVLRVAAYCRVSTDDIDQKLSIHLQIQQYMKRIKENPNWKYAGCYVDDGFSGTNTAHRQGFQKLMKDAMEGKIDMIITKAVSRFARNLMDCIGWVEALQNHDPPIRVFFEQENLDTMSQTSGINLNNQGVISMRKLASIQRIWAIEPIEGADRIELAHVLGWQCVVNKGQFQPMDTAVYFEIDSFLPVRPAFEFLRSSSYKNTNIMGEGFRLRTMRFRGQVSQGLLLPVASFPEIPNGLEIGADVTKILGVKKWEIEERASTGGTVHGDLPGFIPHTDETRVQAEPSLIQAFAGLEYYISTKMDGSSHSIGVDGDGFHVTGHNYEYKDDGASSFYELVKSRGYREKVEAFAGDNRLSTLAIQGELCAPGIQQNRLKLAKPEWYVFSIYENGRRVGLKRMLEVCHALGMESVPIEEIDTDLPSKYPSVEALLARADGEYPKGGKKEGIVIRPTEPVFSPIISGSLSMKVVNNKYLLKNDG